MKKRIMALSLAALLTLSGCSSMLNTAVVEVAPHEDLAATADDPSVFRAKSYPELVSAVALMVRQGTAHGTIHISNYTPRKSVEEDLAAACLEVTQEDPLGAYSVDFIKHELAYILSYYEASVYITYRRTQDQVKNIVSVTRTSAIREELRGTLGKFSSEAVLRVRYYNEDPDYIRALVRQAYFDTPLAALGMPAVSVSLYPDVGTERIIEIILTYPEDQEALRKKSITLATRAEALGAGLTGLQGDAAAAEAFRLLRAAVTYVPPGSNHNGDRLDTAYAALVEGRADSQGMALGYQLFAQLAGLESTVVVGKANGATHYWNVVKLTGGEYRHVEPSLSEGFRLSDADMIGLGYTWDRESTPLCGEQPPEPTPEPVAETMDGAVPEGEMESEPPSEPPVE